MANSALLDVNYKQFEKMEILVTILRHEPQGPEICKFILKRNVYKKRERQTRRSNHYISRFYLAGFSDKNNKGIIWILITL